MAIIGQCHKIWLQLIDISLISKLQYDLELADVYAAVFYYYDHRSEIDETIAVDEAFAEAFRRNNPLLLQAKLKAK